jgi:hypothetical protein
MEIKMQEQSLFDIEQTIKTNKSKGEKILTPNIQKMLKILASMGMDRKVFACLLELAEVDAQLIKYLAGPTITGGREWRDAIPSWVWQAIAIDRLDTILEEVDKEEVGKLATPSEVLAVMMPITFEVPLSWEWTNVYLYCSHTTLIKHQPFPNYDYNNLWESIGIKPIDYKQIKHDYESLATDIRTRVIKSASNEWGKKLKQKPLLSNQSTEENNPQLSLF